MWNYGCDWNLGFSVNPQKKGTIGYLTFWSGCSGLSLTKDVEVWNPISTATQAVGTGPTIKCIGLIEAFEFAGDVEAPIKVTAYVSRDTAANVRAKLSKPITATTVQVAWYIVSYDEDRKQWYEAAFIKDGQRAKASIDTVNGEVQLAVDTEPVQIMNTLDIRAFRMTFQMVPAPAASNTLQFASGATQRLVTKWDGA